MKIQTVFPGKHDGTFSMNTTYRNSLKMSALRRFMEYLAILGAFDGVFMRFRNVHKPEKQTSSMNSSRNSEKGEKPSR